MSNSAANWDYARFEDYVVRHANNRGIVGRPALTRAVGIKAGMLSKYFSGTERPSPETLWKFHLALGAPYEELLALTGRKPAGADAPKVPSVTLPPLAQELAAMLADTSPLAADDKQVLETIVDRVIDPYRRRMKVTGGRRRAS